MRKPGARVAERLTHSEFFYEQKQTWVVGSVLQKALAAPSDFLRLDCKLLAGQAGWSWPSVSTLYWIHLALPLLYPLPRKSDFYWLS